MRLASCQDTRQASAGATRQACQKRTQCEKNLNPAPTHWSSMQPRFQIAGHHRITASSGSEPLDNLVGRWLRLHRSFKAQPTAPSSERSHSTTLFAREVHSNGSQKDVVSVVNLGDVKTLASTPGQHSVKLHHQATTNFCSWHQCQWILPIKLLIGHVQTIVELSLSCLSLTLQSLDDLFHHPPFESNFSATSKPIDQPLVSSLEPRLRLTRDALESSDARGIT